jgi:hypothetical protein
MTRQSGGRSSPLLPLYSASSGPTVQCRAESDNVGDVPYSFKRRENIFRANLTNQLSHAPSFSHRLRFPTDQLRLKDLGVRPISEPSVISLYVTLFLPKENVSLQNEDLPDSMRL